MLALLQLIKANIAWTVTVHALCAPPKGMASAQDCLIMPGLDVRTENHYLTAMIATAYNHYKADY